MIIFLTGYMGAGKTTQGKSLASLLGFEFIDLDRCIEKAEGRKIPAIFSMEGEEFFRKLESKYLRKLDPGRNMVVAVGGGTPCFSGNMDWMNLHGLTVYLKMEPGSLAHRLSDSITDRPLLSGKSEIEKLEFIKSSLEKRESYYNQSKIIVDGLNLKPSVLKDIIEQSL